MNFYLVAAYLVSMYTLCGLFVCWFYSSKKKNRFSNFIKSMIELGQLFSPMTRVIVWAAFLFAPVRHFLTWPRILLKEIRSI